MEGISMRVRRVHSVLWLISVQEQQYTKARWPARKGSVSLALVGVMRVFTSLRVGGVHVGQMCLFCEVWVFYRQKPSRCEALCPPTPAAPNTPHAARLFLSLIPLLLFRSNTNPKVNTHTLWVCVFIPHVPHGIRHIYSYLKDKVGHLSGPSKMTHLSFKLWGRRQLGPAQATTTKDSCSSGVRAIQSIHVG